MFQAIYGTWDPRAPYGHATDMRWASIPHGVAGLLLDQQFGAAAERADLPGRTRRICRAVAARPPADSGVAASPRRHTWLPWRAFTCGGRGRSSPARFLVPVLLPLALPLAAWWAACDQPNRARGHARAAGGERVPHGRAGAGRPRRAHLQLARRPRAVASGGQSVGEPHYALPSLFQAGPAAAWMVAAAWFAVAALGWLALRRIERRRRPRSVRGSPACSASRCWSSPAARASGGRCRPARRGTRATGWSPSPRAPATRMPSAVRRRLRVSAVSAAC